jgi:hypothetical protein
MFSHFISREVKLPSDILSSLNNQIQLTRDTIVSLSISETNSNTFNLHPTSISEKMYADMIKEVLCTKEEWAGYVLSTNEMLYGFEADIVIRGRRSNDSNNNSTVKGLNEIGWVGESHDDSGESGSRIPTFNIEIDGPTHRHPTKSRFCSRRDAYLGEAHGVKILRIDLLAKEFRNRKPSSAEMRELLTVKLRNMLGEN